MTDAGRPPDWASRPPPGEAPGAAGGPGAGEAGPPGTGAAGPPGASGPAARGHVADERGEERPPWPASAGVSGFLLGIVATLVLVTLVGAFYLAAGFDDPADAASFEFVAIAAQSLALVAVTLGVTSRIAPLSARQFGFRAARGSAVRWSLAALFGYFFIALVYSLVASPPEDDLPQELGANESTSLAIVTGVFVIAVAPVVEEFFFRGFLYQAFRNRIGVWGAAITSGLVFGAIHLKPEFLFPLAALGVLLALLFEKTKSLWPCIAVHAVNNTLAFAVLL